MVGPILKTQYVRSRGLLDSSAHQSCIRCGTRDGTVVPAHYTGIRQQALGKGKSVKCHDCCTADLCRACHEYFDQPEQRKSIDASEEFLFLIALTTVRRMQRGVLVVTPKSKWDEIEVIYG